MIARNKNQFEEFDVLMDSRWETKVHEHGLVALVDVMPRMIPAGKSSLRHTGF